MSDPTTAAQALDEDLRCLMGGALFGSLAVKERVWGAAEGPPRSVEESRDRYRNPIVEAFAASGAETLAEFPERVKKLARSDTDHQVFLRSQIAALQDRVAVRTTERDQARADADRYHAEVVTLRESEHNARLQVQEAAAVNANLAAERNRLIREAALGPDTEKRLREEARQLRAERDRYKALAEQQSATVAELRGQFGGALATVDELRADLTATRKAHADLTAAHAKAVAALSSGSLAELRASRDSLSGRVSDLTVENAGLRRSVRRLCRILGKAMAGDL